MRTPDRGRGERIGLASAASGRRLGRDVDDAPPCRSEPACGNWSITRADPAK
jgi:hypothetical protein